MSKTQDVINKTKKYIAGNYAPFDVVPIKGEGVFFWDAEGGLRNDVSDPMSPFRVMTDGLNGTMT